MDTLVRPTQSEETNGTFRTTEEDSTLNTTVPSPFPQEERARLLREGTPQPLIDVGGSEIVSNGNGGLEKMPKEVQQQQILPSITLIQHSCITALLDLLVPTSTISESPHPPAFGSEATRSQSSRLQEVVRHLQDSGPEDQMTQVSSAQTETELLRNLQRLVVQRSDRINPEDAILAQTLVSLLAHFDRLATINAAQEPRPSSSGASTSYNTGIRPPTSEDLFDVLRHQVNNLQIERLNTSGEPRSGSPPVFAVESALLWSRIDQDLEDVLAMCRQRTDVASFAIPPEYEQTEELPQYENDGSIRRSVDNKSLRSTLTTETNEKMRMDLEAVTSAIDRLYVVLPQLHNQRVEIKDDKRRELERARAAARSEGDEARDLERMLGLISKASERKMVDQSVIIDSRDMEARLQRAHRRDIDQQQLFNAQLAEYSGSGRLSGQDAILRAGREKNPEALLSLPEFMREPMPNGLKKQPASEATTSSALPPKPLDKKRSFHRLSSRTRSMSSPSLSWLLPSTSRSSTPVPEKSPPAHKGKGKRPSSSNGRTSPPTTPEATCSPNMTYVAEFHENLRQVRAFITLTGVPAGASVEALIDEEELDTVHLRCGDASIALKLPVKAASAGPLDVQWSGTYYELKTATVPNSTRDPFSDDAESKRDMLAAPHLISAAPTSFICASCSLPLVQGSKVTDYRDLPSEHWAELVEAWMCHSDQKLNKEIMQHANGFEPESGRALVGGSYILFNKENVVTANLVDYEQSKRLEDWFTIRCICGSIVGRRRDVTLADNSKSTTYRLAKYSIRVLSSTMHIAPVPLTTFVVEDMIELQQAHASYRFIIMDEEEERPRLLIWLFKPSLRLAYAVPTQYQMPKNGSVSCAKILFRLLGPSVSPAELTSILSKHPGFPQAEHLLYPIHVCRRLAGMLRESSTAYPEGLRTMTGLDVGWLPK